MRKIKQRCHETLKLNDTWDNMHFSTTVKSFLLHKVVEPDKINLEENNEIAEKVSKPVEVLNELHPNVVKNVKADLCKF